MKKVELESVINGYDLAKVIVQVLEVSLPSCKFEVECIELAKYRINVLPSTAPLTAQDCFQAEHVIGICITMHDIERKEKESDTDPDW